MSIQAFIKNLEKHGFALGIIFVFAVIGWLSYPSYGLSWDEGAQHDIGLVTYQWIGKQDSSLLQFKDKDYGVAMELPLYAAEQLLDLKSGHEVFLFRHIAAHLFFLLSAFVFYLLLGGIYKNKFTAITGMLIYVLSPVIYAHSFFNTKDIPTLAVYVICFYALLLFHKNNSLSRLLLLAFCTALLLNLRLSGLIFMGIVGLYFLLQFFNSKQKSKLIGQFAGYAVLSFAFLYATWPYLWPNPINNFTAAIDAMTHFRWSDNLLLFGKQIHSASLPWYYLPAWIGLNNSVVIILLSLAACMLVPVLAIRNFYKNRELEALVLFNFLFWVVLVVSLGSVFILKPYLYDSWRQFFYLAPFVLLLAIYTAHVLLHLQKTKWLAITAMLYVVVHYAFSIYSLFPYSHIYFTELEDKKTKNHLRQNYEMDYWGTVYREALEYVLEKDKRPKVPVKFNTAAGPKAAYIIRPEDEKRLEPSYETGDYFITCYRYHPQDYAEYKDEDIIYQIVRYNNVICTLYDLRQDSIKNLAN